MQNEQDLEKLVHTHTAALLRYCTGLLGCEADAQDAVQKTFIKAWQQRHTLRHDGTDNERAWLYRIAYRTSLDMLRAIKRAAAYPTPEPLEQDPGISEELRAALNTLAPLDRALILERVLDGLDYAALACIHGRPAVAEHLPDAPPARHPRWKLAICLAAPLLIAAGVLAGTAEFTNLRENPRPSFAPEANTGYAITYERQYFALDEDLLAGMVANHNGEMSDDGWLPMNAKINGQLHPTDADYADWYTRAARGYDSWVEMTVATGLPLAQNTLLDEGDTSTFPSIAMYPSGMIDIPDEYDDGMPYTPKFQEYPAGFIPIGRGDTPDKLYLRTGVLLDGYNVEIMAVAYLGDAPKEMATDLYWQKSAGLTWQCESYPMANGNTALIPHCTSNPNSRPYIQSRAYFAQDGILYQVYCRPYTDSLCYSASQENIWAELKVVLDGFA